MSGFADREGLSSHEDRPRSAAVVSGVMAADDGEHGTEPDLEVTALAINVAIPEHLQWTDSRRDVEFRLTTLNVRMLPDGRLAAKAYGRPTAGGRGAYTSFRVPDDHELTALIDRAASRAGAMWSGHRSVGA